MFTPNMKVSSLLSLYWIPWVIKRNSSLQIKSLRASTCVICGAYSIYSSLVIFQPALYTFTLCVQIFEWRKYLRELSIVPEVSSSVCVWLFEILTNKYLTASVFLHSDFSALYLEFCSLHQEWERICKKSQVNSSIYHVSFSFILLKH